MRLRVASALALVACGIVVTVVAVAGTASAVLVPQLPDLEQVVPYQVNTFAERHGNVTRFALTFGAASQNVGDGPLVVVGRRSSRAAKFLTADQYIDTGDPDTNAQGAQRVVPRIGRLRYVISSDHEHFHFLGFMRYELRRASDFRRVGRDRKTGFCLGDRYEVGELPRGPVRAAAEPSRITSRDFDDTCARGQPSRLRVIEGISPGKGDDYRPRLEGQSIDVTDLPNGRYVLVHRSNAERLIHESNYRNNVSSVVLSLRRRGERLPPRVRVLRRCAHTERCPAG